MGKEYKCHTRYRKDYLICLCKVGNPACDRYPNCEEETFRNIDEENMKKLMQEHDKYKRVNGRIRRK